MKKYDVRDLACPGPVLKLRGLLDEGEREIQFHVADELCRSNVTRFAASRRLETEVEPQDDGTFLVRFTAGEDSGSAGVTAEPTAVATGAVAGPTLVQVTADTMGSGDDELGGLLLRSFIKTQAELDTIPDAIVFYNSGVKLCCEGSLLLDDLRALEASGIEIIACGTCLNYFELADRLAVGRVTDMLEIAGRLAAAGRVVRP
ncbi:MAG: sulfurtransferase-like selenium metabolism protein YedF [Candidatus Sulfomarinibacteraceae bacterium]